MDTIIPAVTQNTFLDFSLVLSLGFFSTNVNPKSRVSSPAPPRSRPLSPSPAVSPKPLSASSSGRIPSSGKTRPRRAQTPARVQPPSVSTVAVSETKKEQLAQTGPAKDSKGESDPQRGTEVVVHRGRRDHQKGSEKPRC